MQGLREFIITNNNKCNEFLGRFVDETGEYIYIQLITDAVISQTLVVEVSLEHIKAFDKQLYINFVNYPEEMIAGSSFVKFRYFLASVGSVNTTDICFYFSL
jgi:hypothetical protein